MTKSADIKETRSVVLLDEVRQLGKAGELKRVAPERAAELIASVRARPAKIDDFKLPQR